MENKYLRFLSGLLILKLKAVKSFEGVENNKQFIRIHLDIKYCFLLYVNGLRIPQTKTFFLKPKANQRVIKISGIGFFQYRCIRLGVDPVPIQANLKEGLHQLKGLDKKPNGILWSSIISIMRSKNEAIFNSRELSRRYQFSRLELKRKYLMNKQTYSLNSNTVILTELKAKTINQCKN